MKEELNKTIEVLQRGGIILYPTDTIWGIGCDATNEAAVERICAIKQREEAQAMLALIDSPDYLHHYVDLPEIALELIECSVKPLTIIYPGGKNVASRLIAEDGTLGLRVTREEFSKQLCRILKRPIVSTSANVSGQPAPGNFSDISDEIIRLVDYAVHYRRQEKRISTASSIIRLGEGGIIKVIRE
jgi:L-threonylcarbamoyladenylate synthase